MARQTVQLPGASPDRTQAPPTRMAVAALGAAPQAGARRVEVKDSDDEWLRTSATVTGGNQGRDWVFWGRTRYAIPYLRQDYSLR